jgi:hypothetical protein
LSAIAVVSSSGFVGIAGVALQFARNACSKICGACPVTLLPGNVRIVEVRTVLEISKKKKSKISSFFKQKKPS